MQTRPIQVGTGREREGSDTSELASASRSNTLKGGQVFLECVEGGA